MKNYIIPKNEKRFGVELSTGVIRCISEPEDFFDAEQDLSISLIADEKMYKNFKYTKTVDGKPEFVLLNNKIIVEYIYKSDDCSENAFAEILFMINEMVTIIDDFWDKAARETSFRKKAIINQVIYTKTQRL